MRSHRFTKPYNLKNYKFGIVTLVGILSVLGILVVGSAKESLQSKQILGVIIGFTAMIVVSLIDYMWIMNFYWVLYALSIIMLAAVKLFGENVNGATRWIKVGFIQFQPSELAKILLIIFFAKFLMEHEEDINDKFTLIKYAVLAGIPLALILIEPNLSTTICTALMICLMIYIAGLSYKFIGTVLIILVPIAVIFLSIVVQPNQKILKDYQQKRILAFIEPEKYESDEAYQQKNSVMAIGSGQLTGKGLDNNTTTSVKNGNFILEPQTDFIFAVVGEELGFIGIRFCRRVYNYCVITIDCDTMYLSWDTIARPCRKNHMLRCWRPDRHTKFYQHWCCHQNFAKYRSSITFCKLWSDFSCKFIYWNWISLERRITTEKIPVRSE